MSGSVGGVQKDTYTDADERTGKALTWDMLKEIHDNQIKIRDNCAERLESCTAKFQELRDKKPFSLMNYLLFFLKLK